MIAENLSMAEYNLARERELQEARERLIASCSRITLILFQRATILVLNRTVSAFWFKFSTKLFLKLLHLFPRLSRVILLFSQQRIAQEFVDGEKTIDAFLLEYIPKRTEVHVRTIKVEKFDRYLRGGSASSQQTFY
ncbi:uncharacterized protein LOC129594149 [Paramacrobiotus metropolitanus]|uniref:uncharacterized protein LOC129594149 n=1 Tax=Paramacrobiotus metropolitanus TaxID=2943436 RepID=UPI0024457F06|nr:uncharacterized protein LOC129594149 [Paramacrobiotus metropolitanus]